MMSVNVLASKPPPKAKPGHVKVVRALYNYTARTTDELSFHEGDILYVYDQSHSEWWKACIGSKNGLIPSTCFNGKFDEIMNPLHEAARRGNLPFLQECLSKKVSATGLDSMRNTPLYWACVSGHLQCVKCLLDQPNPPVNAQNNFGDTPLHGASAKNNYEIVEMLLKSGAQADIRNHNGETPETLASNNGVKNILQRHKFNQGISGSGIVNPEEYDDDSD